MNIMDFFFLDIVQEIRAAHKLMEQTLESKLNSFNANKNEFTVSNFFKTLFCYKQIKLKKNIFLQNDSSQLSLINERLEKLEKLSDKSKR